jgi:hypothetical protein
MAVIKGLDTITTQFESTVELPTATVETQVSLTIDQVMKANPVCAAMGLGYGSPYKFLLEWDKDNSLVMLPTYSGKAFVVTTSELFDPLFQSDPLTYLTQKQITPNCELVITTNGSVMFVNVKGGKLPKGKAITTFPKLATKLFSDCTNFTEYLRLLPFLGDEGSALMAGIVAMQDNGNTSTPVTLTKGMETFSRFALESHRKHGNSFKAGFVGQVSGSLPESSVTVKSETIA